jgi:hypothetical protein
MLLAHHYDQRVKLIRMADPRLATFARKGAPSQRLQRVILRTLRRQPMPYRDTP